MKVEVRGEKELFKRLQKFRTSTQKKFLGQALTAANTPIRNAVRNDTPRRSGRLRMSITSKVKRYKTGAVGLTGQDMGKTQRDADRAARYAKRSRARRYGGIPGRYGTAAPSHLIENAVQPHRIPSRKASLEAINTFWRGKSRGGAQIFTRGIRHPGHAGAAFIDSAGRKAIPVANRVFYTKLGALMDKEAARLAGRG